LRRFIAELQLRSWPRNPRDRDAYGNQCGGEHRLVAEGRRIDDHGARVVTYAVLRVDYASSTTASD